VSNSDHRHPIAAWIEQLDQGIARRVRSEQELVSKHDVECASFAHQLQQHRATGEQTLESAIQAIENDYTQTRTQIEQRFDTTFQSTKSNYDRDVTDIQSGFTQETDQARREHRELEWMVESVFDESSGESPPQIYNTYRHQATKTREFLETEWAHLENLYEDCIALAQSRHMRSTPHAVEPQMHAEDIDQLLARFESSATEAGRYGDKLKQLMLARLFSGVLPLYCTLAVWLIATPIVLAFRVNPLSVITQPENIDWNWLRNGSGLAAVATLCILGVTYAHARMTTGRMLGGLFQQLTDARGALTRWLKLTKSEIGKLKQRNDDWQERFGQHRGRSLDNAARAFSNRDRQRLLQRDQNLDAIEQQYVPLLQQLIDQRDQQIQQLDQQHQQHLQEHVATQQRELLAREQEIEQRQHQAQQRRDATWQTMADGWNQLIAEFTEQTRQLDQTVRQEFPDWSTLAQSPWRPPQQIPAGIPIGHFELNLAEFVQGVSDDPRLRLPTEPQHIPVLLPFPSNTSMLIRSGGQGRHQAISLLKATMLRLLTSLPPGKTRFTIIDPMGLGEEFSAFMHLADYDELLVTNRIWTESAHIEKRLTDLTLHMENVFQTYLRNEFENIQDYNAHAGEVAEPYHILVIANFPTNFSDNAVQRLTSIVSSGPRCGVYTLISVDEKQQLPHNFDLQDLESSVNRVRCDDRGCAWSEPRLDRLAFHPQALPSGETIGKIVRAVGEQSGDARRVEVAFSRIAPAENDQWTSDSRFGLSLPLGRAGATKLQQLQLGRGTSQHVMIAGKTGSGKSTLLHVLIVNAALRYSPDELEFYLIDFKKGVEFKAYATHKLPHARVVAIESDREFGLSVLERLDEILKERGDAFRQAGVQDLAAYREQRPQVRQPRILLLIDEFQEFFVEDDRIAQSAALLLDRLVRQGRAFGIHILLGSQTLAGAYSLPRSTLGQVAIRIALQCSETDAHLILSEENTAARLLTRPGEAIYNDANGLLEGNHPFQVAWLSETERDTILTRVAELAEQHGRKDVLPTVFEGQVAADPTRNPELYSALHAERPSHVAQQTVAWLGEAVAIKAPTQIVFQRRNGVNLLLCGPDADAAHGICANCLVSVAAQLPSAGGTNDPVFQVLAADQTSADPKSLWNRLADVVPQPVRVDGSARTSDVMSQMVRQLQNRQATAAEDRPPLILILSDLAQLTELRKEDDDFGFGSPDPQTPASPSQQLAEILKLGPSVGIHTIVWSDTLNSLNRCFGSQNHREFEFRIGFQMSGNDSSHLFDSPQAAKLGRNRAILYRTSDGSYERFRPYFVPTDAWLHQLSRYFQDDDAGKNRASIDQWNVI